MGEDRVGYLICTMGQKHDAHSLRCTSDGTYCQPLDAQHCGVLVTIFEFFLWAAYLALNFIVSPM